MQLLQYQDININAIIACLQQAGEGIMSFYHNSYTIDTKSDESPVTEADVLQQKIYTLFKASNDINYDLIETANHGEYDLLLVGFGQSIFEGTLLGKVLGFTTRIINPEAKPNCIFFRFIWALNARPWKKLHVANSNFRSVSWTSAKVA